MKSAMPDITVHVRLREMFFIIVNLIYIGTINIVNVFPVERTAIAITTK
jgi:hypothetical protein